MFDELWLKMETHKWGSGTDQIPKKSANTGWGMVIVPTANLRQEKLWRTSKK